MTGVAWPMMVATDKPANTAQHDQSRKRKHVSRIEIAEAIASKAQSGGSEMSFKMVLGKGNQGP